MARGGARDGSGRPTIAKELGTADLARKVLIAKYGSLESALQSLLEKDDPVLKKFVFEHAFGKTPDKLDITTRGEKVNSPILSDTQFKKLTELIDANSNTG